MNTNTHTRTTLTLALAAALALSGCATLPGNNPPPGTSTVASGAIHGGIIGCGVGAVAGLIHGGNLGFLVKGCAVGAAAGAVVGGVVAYHDQMVAANALAAQARQAGAVAQIRTRTVQTTNAQGQRVNAQALGQLRLALDPHDVAIHGSATAGLLQKTANLAGASKTPVHILVVGPLAARQWIAGTLLADLGSNPGQVSISEQAAARPGLVLAPMPEVRRHG